LEAEVFMLLEELFRIERGKSTNPSLGSFIREPEG
jgi:hypothetical protein